MVKRIFRAAKGRVRLRRRVHHRPAGAKDHFREHRRQSQEMFVPLSHPSEHAQCDFGEALVVIGRVQQKAHYFVLDLPHKDGCFIKAYPAETTEAFLGRPCLRLCLHRAACPRASYTTIPNWQWLRHWETAVTSRTRMAPKRRCSLTTIRGPVRASRQGQ